jgi:hypothetical protein
LIFEISFAWTNSADRGLILITAFNLIFLFNQLLLISSNLRLYSPEERIMCFEIEIDVEIHIRCIIAN